MISNHGVTFHNDGTVSFFKLCPVCGKRSDFNVTAEEYTRWTSGGEFIQNVWPNKSKDEREVMLSGTDTECFNKLFPPEEDDCNGLCMTAYDIGLEEYGSQIAYAHPDCPIHGEKEE